MKRGERAMFTIKSDYAYGKSGSPPKIPGDATLQFDVELLSWQDEKDISPNKDGSIFLKTLNEGEDWATPEYESICKVKYNLRIKDGPIVYNNESADIAIGEEQVIEGLDIALQKMKKGSDSLVTIAPKYAFGEKGDENLHIPPHATIVCEVSLLDFTKTKPAYEMTGAEKVEGAQKRRFQGNDLYKAKKYTRALEKYKKAENIVSSDYKMTDEEKTRSKTREIELLLEYQCLSIADEKLQGSH